MKTPRKIKAENIYLMFVIMFFITILMYSAGITEKMKKFFSEDQPVVEFSVRENKIILNENHKCYGSINLVEFSCRNHVLTVKLKNTGNTTIRNMFVYIVKGKNMTAYHAFSNEENIKPGDIFMHSFKVKIDKIFGLEIVNMECPEIKYELENNIDCK